MKKSMEKKISELEEELKRTELHLVMIGEYEGALRMVPGLARVGLHYQLFRDPKKGKWVAIASPFQIEKRCSWQELMSSKPKFKELKKNFMIL